MKNSFNNKIIFTITLACVLPLEGFAAGFLEDASANVNLRNFYINRSFTNPAFPQGKAEEWTQSFIFDAKSGFTEGTVGLGADVLGLYSLKLEGAKGTGGTQLLPINGYGRPADNFGRLAVSGKMYAIHEPHLPPVGVLVYRGISGEQFQGKSAS